MVNVTNIINAFESSGSSPVLKNEDGRLINDEKHFKSIMLPSEQYGQIVVSVGEGDV